jgi:hypothetical protein
MDNIMPIFSRLALLLLALPLFTHCLQDDCRSTRTFVQFEPVYLTEAQARAGITVEGPRPVGETGKIYAWKQYLFLGERNKGIHVIDYSNPAQPQQIAFWNLPGNVDMAIRDHYLYADQYMDLVTFDISNMQQPVQVCREENVYQMFGFDQGRGYIVDYTRTETTEIIDCADDRFNNPWFWNGANIFIDMAAFDVQPGIQNGGSAVVNAGIAGSYARFAQHPQFLYGIDNNNLITFNVDNPACPQEVQTQSVGWDIETIFPWDNWLFVGSSNAVYIFNNSTPNQPVLSQVFQHASGCDPVICDDNFAYVTIRNGRTCNNGVNGTVNQLSVVDIRQLPNATEVATIPMTDPMGLALTETHLFVCDDGLKVFDKTQAPNLTQVAHLTQWKTQDAAYLGNNILLVVGPGNLYLFDVSNPADPKLLSSL